jgi:hypothetical protein
VLDEECLLNSKFKSIHRMVKLLPLGVAVCRRFPLSVGFRVLLETARAGQAVFTEHKEETEDGLLNCEATPTTIRLSRPISTSDLFSQKEAQVVTLNGSSWTMIVHKTQIANRGRPFEWSCYCR